jgi:hypothetical protein
MTLKQNKFICLGDLSRFTGLKVKHCGLCHDYYMSFLCLVAHEKVSHLSLLVPIITSKLPVLITSLGINPILNISAA